VAAQKTHAKHKLTKDVPAETIPMNTYDRRIIK